MSVAIYDQVLRAGNRRGAPITITELAKALGYPRDRVRKVVRVLAQSGGIRLGRYARGPELLIVRPW